MSNNITLINYVNLSMEEKKMVLSWRNNPEVQKWMYDDSTISLANHLFFIELLKKSKDLYFLVKDNDKYIGIIDFTQIKNEMSQFGLYSNPALKGVGKVLLKALCDYAFKTLKIQRLIAEVFVKNTKAMHLYQKFNFRECSKKTINNKDVICLELKNENW